MKGGRREGAAVRELHFRSLDPEPGVGCHLLTTPHATKSPIFPQEDEGYSALYEAGGFMQDSRGLMGVLAGATLGGGTRVNWCASFRTPEHVRREWAAAHGLLCFTGATYESAMDAVCERLGVRTGGQDFRGGGGVGAGAWERVWFVPLGARVCVPPWERRFFPACTRPSRRWGRPRQLLRSRPLRHSSSM